MVLKSHHLRGLSRRDAKTEQVFNKRVGDFIA